MQTDIVQKLIVDFLLTPSPPKTQEGIDEDLLEAASATTALLLSEEDIDGVGDEGSTSTEIVIEETSSILKMFVHDVEDDAYAVKANSARKLNLVAKFVAIGVSFCQASKLY